MFYKMRQNLPFINILEKHTEVPVFGDIQSRNTILLYLLSWIVFQITYKILNCSVDAVFAEFTSVTYKFYIMYDVSHPI